MRHLLEKKYNLTRLFLIIFTGIFLIACNDGNSDDDSLNRIFQWGAANPNYLNSKAPPSEVIDRSGLGVGAITGGEVIVYGGKALVSDSTGAVSELEEDESIIVSGVMSNVEPNFFTTTNESIGCQDDLNDFLNDVVGDDEVDRLAAFTIKGSFSSIEYVVENGVDVNSELFSTENVTGTMVGIKSPYYLGDDTFVVDNITVGVAEYPYHVHFVNDEETIVGHVRECEIDAGNEVEIALVNIFNLEMEYGD